MLISAATVGHGSEGGEEETGEDHSTMMIIIVALLFHCNELMIAAYPGPRGERKIQRQQSNYFWNGKTMPAAASLALGIPWVEAQWQWRRCYRLTSSLQWVYLSL